MKTLSLEVMLSLVAAIGGTIAGVGGFFIAYHQMALDEIERSPAISLSCRPEFRLAEIAQNIHPPEDTLLLTESGGQWVHVSGTLEPKSAGTEAAAPEPFARCAVGNYGRFPVLNIRIPIHLTFKGEKGDATSANATADIPLGDRPAFRLEAHLRQGGTLRGSLRLPSLHESDRRRRVSTSRRLAEASLL